MISCPKLIVLLAALAAVPVSGAPHAGIVPVPVGGERDGDACGSLARPIGLKAHGDGFLSLRAGPATSYRELLRLTVRDELFLCTSQGEWAGVVMRDRGGKDCGTGSPAPIRRNYHGPCRSGWVALRYLHVVAG